MEDTSDALNDGEADNKKSDKGVKTDSGKYSHFPSREECRVLVVGSGNSRLSEDMLNDNWGGGIVNIDYSSIVIEQMREKYNDEFYQALQTRLDMEKKLKDGSQGRGKKVAGILAAGKKSLLPKDDKTGEDGTMEMTKMIFECADVTKPLPFVDGAFDLVISKGTLDAVLCSQGSVENARLMMEECSRVLDDKHGVLFVVTYGNPDARMVYFEKVEGDNSDGWWGGGVDVWTVPKPRVGPTANEEKEKNHYIYICKKGEHDEKTKTDSSISGASSNEENIASNEVSEGISSLNLSE